MCKLTWLLGFKVILGAAQDMTVSTQLGKMFLSLKYITSMSYYFDFSTVNYLLCLIEYRIVNIFCLRVNRFMGIVIRSFISNKVTKNVSHQTETPFLIFVFQLCFSMPSHLIVKSVYTVLIFK